MSWLITLALTAPAHADEPADNEWNEWIDVRFESMPDGYVESWTLKGVEAGRTFEATGPVIDSEFWHLDIEVAERRDYDDGRVSQVLLMTEVYRVTVTADGEEERELESSPIVTASAYSSAHITQSSQVPVKTWWGGTRYTEEWIQVSVTPRFGPAPEASGIGKTE